MMRKFNSDPDAKETMLQELDGLLSKPEDRELFGLPPKIDSCKRSLLKLNRELFLKSLGFCSDHVRDSHAFTAVSIRD